MAKLERNFAVSEVVAQGDEARLAGGQTDQFAHLAPRVANDDAGAALVEIDEP